MPPSEFKLRARTFGLGAACGFVAGAVLVGLVVSWYGGAPKPSAGRGNQRPPVVRTDDGMAGVDAPVLEGTRPVSPPPAPETTAGESPAPAAPIVPPSVDELRRRGLEVPVEGIKPEQLVQSFTDERTGARVHQAIDILAPTHTPVKAVEDGTIARLFYSKAGGITIYQFDPTERFCYYYAHLDRYAESLREGDLVRKGQVVGYVGTSGNAPTETPHLHFAVFQLTEEKKWWEGTPIDPYPIWR